MSKLHHGRTQKSALQHLSIVQIVLPALLAALFVFIGVRLDYMYSPAYNIDFQPADIRYVTGGDLEVENITENQFISVNSFSDIKETDCYVRVMFTVPASETARKLTVQSDFEQLKLIIDKEEIVNTLNQTEVFSDVSATTVMLDASDVDYSVEIVQKSGFLSHISVYLLAAGAPAFSDIRTLLLQVVYPAVLIISALLYLNSLHRRKVPALLTAAFFCASLSSLISVFSAYLGKYEKTVHEVAFVLMCFSGLMLIYRALVSIKLTERTVDIITGIGILLCCVIMPISSSQFEVTMIKVLSLYFLTAILICMYYGLRRRKSNGGTDYSEICLVLFGLLTAPQWLYLWSFDTATVASYAQTVFPITMGILLFAMSLHTGETVREIDETRMMEFMPADIGRYNDLLTLMMKEPEYRSHACHVSQYTYAICSHLDMSAEYAAEIAQAAFLHDIGKLMLPKSMLLKKEKLTDDEYELMKLHTKYGAQLFSSATDRMLQIAGIIAMQHHERFDGNGYYGMKGEEINKYAQIVSIADVFDAATSARSYKQSWGFEEGFSYIVEHGGTLFNEQYVEAFSAARNEFLSIYQSSVGQWGDKH